MGHCYTAHIAVHARGDRCTEANTIAPLHLESLRHSDTADHRQSAAARTHHVNKPLRRSAYASGPLFCAYARPLRIGSSLPR